jgi:hypothetical protein
MKSGSSSMQWPQHLQRLDKILETNPKSKGLEGSRDGGKKDSSLDLDLNEDPPELVDEKKKEEKKKDSISRQQINTSQGDSTNEKLKPFEKAYLEQNQKALNTFMQMEKEKLEVEKSRLKMQEALLAAYLLHEGNRKKHKEDKEEKNGGQGRDPDESDVRFWIRKYQLEWKHKEELK